MGPLTEKKNHFLFFSFTQERNWQSNGTVLRFHWGTLIPILSTNQSRRHGMQLPRWQGHRDFHLCVLGAGRRLGPQGDSALLGRGHQRGSCGICQRATRACVKLSQRSGELFLELILSSWRSAKLFYCHVIKWLRGQRFLSKRVEIRWLQCFFTGCVWSVQSVEPFHSAKVVQRKILFFMPFKVIYFHPCDAAGLQRFHRLANVFLCIIFLYYL